MSSKQYHNIPVKPQTAESLSEYKQLGESWDSAVSKLLDSADSQGGRGKHD